MVENRDETPDFTFGQIIILIVAELLAAAAGAVFGWGIALLTGIRGW